MHSTTVDEGSGMTISATIKAPQWWRKWIRRMLLLFCVVYLSIPQCADGTTVGVDIVQCPACERRYVSNVIMSWNSIMMPDGPPSPTGICPWCLFAWSNEPPQRLKAEERARVYAAIRTVPSRISKPVRTKLIRALEEGKSAGIEEYLGRICAVARQGNADISRLSRFTWKEPQPDPSERKQERRLIALLPKMLEARRAGQPEPLPPASGSREMGALFTIADLIRKGHKPAAEYFLRWVVAADEKALERYDYAVERNLAAMATVPGSQWPAVDYTNARVPLISDCLRYIQTGAPMPESLARKISTRNWDELSEIAMSACTARRDRAAASLLSKRITRSRDPMLGDSVVAYYKKLGVPADVPLLARYAQNLYRDSSQDSLSWEGMVRGDVEEAILAINLRALLAGTPPAQ